MGTRRASLVNVLFGWLRKLSMKVKIFLGTLLAICALVTLKFTVKNYYYFFIASAAIHLAGIIVLIYKLFTQKTCSGLSLKTQELTALFLVVRFGCSTLTEADIHTMLDLVSLLSTLLVIWMIRFKLKSSYIKELDNLRLSFVVVPSAVLAVLIHPYTIHLRLTRVLWAFCVYLEAVSVLPQVRFLQNAKMVETFTGYYVFALGVSRFLGMARWIIQIYETRVSYLLLVGNGNFWFLAAFLSEMVQSFILADFCYYYMKSQVDPIVASFSGGAVSMISVLMLIEANNVEQQEKKRCKYCHGTGYLACARCSASGVCLNIDPISVSSASVRPLEVPTTRRCPNCSGAGKVMCPTCLCTGMLMASEHDLRIDPFD